MGKTAFIGVIYDTKQCMAHSTKQHGDHWGPNQHNFIPDLGSFMSEGRVR